MGWGSPETNPPRILRDGCTAHAYNGILLRKKKKGITNIPNSMGECQNTLGERIQTKEHLLQLTFEQCGFELHSQLKNPYISRPVQFKPMLLKGQLYSN